MKYPKAYIPIRATLQHWHTKGVRSCDLVFIDDEDDVSWRTLDDGSELSYDWDVINWDYISQGNV